MIKKLIFSSIVLGLVALSSCYPGSNRTLQNTELVYTVFEESFDFSAKKTYFLDDDVLAIDTAETIPPDTKTKIIDGIVIQMNKKGWTRVFDVDGNGIPTESAAVVILASALTGTVEGVSYWPGYGGWYGGWWGWGYKKYYGWPGYGWGGVAIPYSYDVGTIYIDMLDRSTYDAENEKIDLVWMSAMNGVLSSSGFDTNTRIDRVITQAFEQSPYL